MKIDSQSNRGGHGIGDGPELDPSSDIDLPGFGILQLVRDVVESDRKGPGVARSKFSKKTVGIVCMVIFAWLAMAVAIAWRDQNMSIQGVVESGVGASCFMFVLSLLLLKISSRMKEKPEAVLDSRRFARVLLAVALVFGMIGAGLSIFVFGVLI